jgi:hypothetical protein
VIDMPFIVTDHMYDDSEEPKTIIRLLNESYLTGLKDAIVAISNSLEDRYRGPDSVVSVSELSDILWDAWHQINNLYMEPSNIGWPLSEIPDAFESRAKENAKKKGRKA